MSKGKGGSHGGRSAPMTSNAASRIQSASARNPGSPTGQSAFAPRAQSAGANNKGDSNAGN